MFNCGSGPEHGHETALVLVSGANCGCGLHRFSSPTRWNVSRGQVRPETGRKPKTNYDLCLPILSEGMTTGFCTSAIATDVVVSAGSAYGDPHMSSYLNLPSLWSGFWGARACADPQNRFVLGPGKISFHAYIYTKLGLAVLAFA